MSDINQRSMKQWSQSWKMMVQNEMKDLKCVSLEIIKVDESIQVVLRNIPQLCVSGPWFYSLRISGVRKNINVVLLS